FFWAKSTINPTDKFLEIDGKKTFIITVVGLCNKYDKPATPCELQNQPFNIEVYGRAFGYQYAYPQDAPNATIRDLFEAANVYYTIPVYSKATTWAGYTERIQLTPVSPKLIGRRR
ncbi:MAG: hypothetical protein OIN66_18720, partial [Candidatus Methanoperedens sp.]|nr:hypothetical protein [Candidatus Methanoperedens sp.]